MFKSIVKTVDMTVVSYSLIDVADGVPQFIPQPNIYLKGDVPLKKVRKILVGRVGPDAQFAVTKLTAGRFTLEMTAETFISHATVSNFIPVNGEPAAPSKVPASQEDEGDGGNSDSMTEGPETGAEE